ncbi:MAG TPA: hypothetical protein VHQ01_07105, partial [Pyrinomonadaceae bacterium]|nr:hypothetical protein [Pyrinomonadaceae bacterium]
MPETRRPLGKLVAVHVLAPEHIQRAVFIAVLSFVFFLAMMVVFYIRENVLYFLLASAFLVVYIVTLLSWIVQRRNVVSIYEQGLTYKKRAVLWAEIESVTDSGETGEIIVRDEKPILLPKTLFKFDSLIKSIRN